MHILFLSDSFPPESNAPASRLHEHARRWVSAGHRVTVITCAPNLRSGEVFEGYANKLYQRESIDGIDVVRVKTLIAPNPGVAMRTLDHLSFMVSAFVAGMFQKRSDVVVATSPPVFAAIAGWALAAIKRRPFVFEARDVSPASIEAVGATTTRRLIGFLERVETFLSRRARAIIALTQSFKEQLVERGIDSEKIHVVTNGVDLSTCVPSDQDELFSSELGLSQKFVVGYVGTHGMAHALENALEAAALLLRESDVHFLFVGDGATRASLIQKQRAMGLFNVTFYPALPKAIMPAIWSVCDLALVHLRDSPLFETVIPSKLFEAMGMGLPIVIASPDGEATRVVEQRECGVVVPPEDPEALAEAVLGLANDSARMRRLIGRSQAAAPAYSRDILAQEMLLHLADAAGVTVRSGAGPRVREPFTDVEPPAPLPADVPARGPALRRKSG